MFRTQSRIHDIVGSRRTFQPIPEVHRKGLPTMPSLHGLFIGVDGAKDIGTISDSHKAADFLSKLAYLFSKEFPYLTGQPTIRFSSLAEPDKYVIHLEAKLGTLEAGYYLLIGSPARKELEALLHS